MYVLLVWSLAGICRQVRFDQESSITRFLYPDTIHGYVDSRDKDSNTELEVSRLPAIQHEHANTVDDDLQ